LDKNKDEGFGWLINMGFRIRSGGNPSRGDGKQTLDAVGQTFLLPWHARTKLFGLPLTMMILVVVEHSDYLE
jgi:hypothetical protein